MIYKLIRYFVVVTFLGMIGAGVSIYLSYQKFKENPEALTHLLQGLQKTLPQVDKKIASPAELKEKVSQSHQQLEMLMAETAATTVSEIPQKEFEEKRLLKLQDANELIFVLRETDIQIEPYGGAEIEINYLGQLIQLQKERLIQMVRMDQKMKIIFASEATKLDYVVREVQKKGQKQPSPMKAKILIPQSYRGRITVQNQSGSINIIGIPAQRMSLETTEAGEVNVVIPSNLRYYFDLKSQDGNIVNESGLSVANYDEYKPQIKVRTEAGNITISKN